MIDRIDYRFRRCWVSDIGEVERRWIRTTFPNGFTLDATTEPQSEWQAKSKRLGYGNRGKYEDVWRCCFDSVIFHTVIADIFGYDYSPTLWTQAAVAAGAAVSGSMLNADQQQVEIALVENLQGYFNAAAKPIIDVKYLAEAAGVTVSYLKRDFGQRIRAARAYARESCGEVAVAPHADLAAGIRHADHG